MANEAERNPILDGSRTLMASLPTLKSSTAALRMYKHIERQPIRGESIAKSPAIKVRNMNFEGSSTDYTIQYA